MVQDERGGVDHYAGVQHLRIKGKGREAGGTCAKRVLGRSWGEEDAWGARLRAEGPGHAGSGWGQAGGLREAGGPDLQKEPPGAGPEGLWAGPGQGSAEWEWGRERGGGVVGVAVLYVPRAGPWARARGRGHSL